MAYADNGETEMQFSDCKVNIIIPNWNGMHWLPGCLKALAQQTFRHYDITIIDNGSTDESAQWITQNHPEIRLLCNQTNIGFAPAVNQGIRATGAEYVVLLNTDTEPKPDWLEQLVEAIKQAPEHIGGVASKMLLFSDESRIENAGDLFSWCGETIKRGYGDDAAGYSSPCEVFSICAGAAIYRRACLEDTGYFDERFFAYLEDVDIGMRARIRGWSFIYEPKARILHHGHASGLKKAGYVRLVARNRLMLFFKNIPASMLLRNLPKIIYGQFYFMLVYRHPIAFIAGITAALAHLPRLRRECHRLWKDAKISRQEFSREILPSCTMPPIRRILAKKLTGRHN